jgi:hypothetical protein
MCRSFEAGLEGRHKLGYLAVDGKLIIMWIIRNLAVKCGLLDRHG